MTRARRDSVQRYCAVGAAAVYLAVALWLLRAALAAPSQLVPWGADPPWSGAGRNLMGLLDQTMVVSVVARNAAVLATRPWELFSGALCFPTPRPHTLGEHMFGEGLLAAPAYLATRDPLVAYNAALVLTLWVPALAMYALAFHFTRSAPGAFIGGLLFAFGPMRIVDTSHPYVHGDLWTPLVLLFWTRLLERGRWRDALGFAGFMSLELLESFYSVLETSLLLSVFGSWLAWRYRRRLVVLVPKFAVAGAAIAASGALVFRPYLATRAEWPVLVRPGTWLHGISEWGFGGWLYPGTVALALAAIALADRLVTRRTQERCDPRLPMLLAGLLLLWAAVPPLDLLGVRIPSPILLVRDRIPGLDSVRGLSLIACGVYLAAAFLGSFAVVPAGRRWGFRGALVACIALSLAALVEQLYPPLTRLTFRRSNELVGLALRPPEPAIELLRAQVMGPTVELPAPGPRMSALKTLSDQLLLRAYHGQPTSACYNSFDSQVSGQVAALAARLPADGAAAALAALGFQYVIVNERLVPRKKKAEMMLAARRGWPFVLAGRAPPLAVYRLRRPARANGDWNNLAGSPELDDGVGHVARATTRPAPDGQRRAVVELAVGNRGPGLFRQLEPVAPSEVVIRWTAAGQTPAAPPLEARARVLLPIALARGDSLPVEIDVPESLGPGLYEVTLARSARPDLLLARSRVKLERGEAGEPAGAAPPDS